MTKPFLKPFLKKLQKAKIFSSGMGSQICRGSEESGNDKAEGWNDDESRPPCSCPPRLDLAEAAAAPDMACAGLCVRLMAWVDSLNLDSSLDSSQIFWLIYYYRVTLVVEYLGWDDYNFGHSTVRLFLPGRGELGRIGWVAEQGGGTSKSMSTGTRPPESPCIWLKMTWENSSCTQILFN